MSQHIDGPREDYERWEKIAWSNATLFLAILGAMKTMNLLRIFPSFGKIVKLVSVVFVESWSFLSFFFYWLFNFNVFKLLLGNKPDMTEYPGVSPALASFLIEYRNSVGDISLPTYEYWQGDVAGAGLMSNLNQTYFMVFQLFMNVVLLNFLIAIIG